MSDTPSTASLDDIQLFDPATLIDPYDAYARLRKEAPVYFAPEMNLYFVTRYDLIREALKDTETYSSRFDAFLAAARSSGHSAMPDDVREKIKAVNAQLIDLPPTMLTLDEPEHTQYRSLVSQLFTGSQVKRSEDQVRAVVDAAADRFAARADDGDDVDFMAEFALQVPLRIIADRLGIPEDERDLFYEGATAAASTLRMSSHTPEESLRQAQLGLDLQQLLVRVMAARREAPRDDMISILANSRLEGEDRLLTDGEALSILNQFLVAGHETTTSTFGWGMLCLCRRPELQGRMRANGKLIRTFVEEALRVESPVQGLPRVTTRDTELGGHPIEAGAFVMLRFGAGNRDERQFPNPDDVDLAREKAAMHLAFGSGIHHCIGAPLARQELNLGFAALLDRVKNVRLAADRSTPKAEPSFILRNLPELYVRFERAVEEDLA